MIRSLLLLTVSAAMIGILAGCGGSELVLVNAVVFEPERVRSIALDYDADDIRVMKSDDDRIALREYMNSDRKRYYAKAKEGGGELRITEGDRPRWTGFQSRVELYLPANYTGALSLHSTSGRLESAVELRLQGDFAADTTSGRMALADIEAENIRIVTTSGEVEASGLLAKSIAVESSSGELHLRRMKAQRIDLRTTSADMAVNGAEGAVRYSTTSGALSAEGLRGSGEFAASGDGAIALAYDEMRGDTAATTKNGNIRLRVPAGLSYELLASTKEGTVRTPLETAEGQPAMVETTVGEFPACAVRLESKNGDIEVEQP